MLKANVQARMAVQRRLDLAYFKAMKRYGLVFVPVCETSDTSDLISRHPFLPETFHMKDAPPNQVLSHGVIEKPTA